MTGKLNTICAAEAGPSVPKGAGALVPPQSWRVLLVDDEPDICELLAHFLVRENHQCELAFGVAEALAWLRVQEFDLLITDKALADGDGAELARAARALRPDLGIILLTGFGAEDCPAGGAEAIDLVLAKPISARALQSGLEQAKAVCQQREEKVAA